MTIRYRELRNRIMTGDLIETSCDGALSFSIRAVTRQGVSHSAMAIRFKGFNLHDDLFVLEAWFPEGLRLRRMSTLVSEAGEVIWSPLTCGMILAAQAAGWMLARVGHGYDFVGATRAVLGLAAPEDDKLFCSEAIAMAYRAAGLIDDIGKVPVPGGFGRYGIHGPAVTIKRKAPSRKKA